MGVPIRGKMKRHSLKKIAAKAEKRRKWQRAVEMVKIATEKALLPNADLTGNQKPEKEVTNV